MSALEDIQQAPPKHRAAQHRAVFSRGQIGLGNARVMNAPDGNGVFQPVLDKLFVVGAVIHDEPPARVLQQMHEVLDHGNQVRVLARFHNHAELANRVFGFHVPKCVGAQIREPLQILRPFRSVHGINFV